MNKKKSKKCSYCEKRDSHVAGCPATSYESLVLYRAGFSYRNDGTIYPKGTDTQSFAFKLGMQKAKKLSK